MRRIHLPRRFGTYLGATALALTLGGCVAYVPGPATGIAVTAPASGQGTTCYAGAYVCTLSTPGQLGTTCACPGLGAPSYGVIN